MVIALITYIILKFAYHAM